MANKNWGFPFKSFKFKVIVGGYLCLAQQLAAHLSLGSPEAALWPGDGVAELGIFGVGRGSLAVTPLSCSVAT